MERGSLRCRTIALIGAYAVAMQTLLSAFIPMLPAALADPLAVLCAHDGGGAGGDPAHRDLPCAAVCAALGHGVAGPLPPDIAIAVTAPLIVVARAQRSDWVPPHLALRGPQSPRGPPLA